MAARATRTTLTLLLAVALAIALVPAAASAAEESATLEYTLELPGNATGSVGGGTGGATPGDPEPTIGGEQLGVAGEGEESSSPLAAAFEAPPAGAVAAVLVALVLALLMGTVRLRASKQ